MVYPLNVEMLVKAFYATCKNDNVSDALPRSIAEMVNEAYKQGREDASKEVRA